MSRVLSLAAPLPGFPLASTLTLSPVEGAAGLFALSSPQAPTLRWFALDTAAHIRHYAPEFSKNQLSLVGNPGDGDLLILAVVTTSGVRPSANLFAPLLVNASNGQCLQAILEAQEWPLRYELPM